MWDLVLHKEYFFIVLYSHKFKVFKQIVPREQPMNNDDFARLLSVMSGSKTARMSLTGTEVSFAGMVIGILMGASVSAVPIGMVSICQKNVEQVLHRYLFGEFKGFKTSSSNMMMGTVQRETISRRSLRLTLGAMVGIVLVRGR